MPLSYELRETDINKSETPELIRYFYDEMQLAGSVARRDNAALSDNLILSVMNASPHTPPDFWIIGKKAQSRLIFGDDWANNALKTQHTPIMNHNQASPAGYMHALANGFHYDIIRIVDPSMSGAIRRLIVPMRDKANGPYLFFATMIHYEEFLRKAA